MVKIRLMNMLTQVLFCAAAKRIGCAGSKAVDLLWLCDCVWGWA